MFSVGDSVSYGTTGVCKIMAQESKTVGSTTINCLILKPIFDKSMTICVPTGNQVLMAKMHRPLNREEVCGLIAQMPEQRVQCPMELEERRRFYNDTLRGGDHLALLCMVKSIYEYKRERLGLGKHLSAMDESAMHEAETMLYTEFALALDLEPDQVVPFIRTRLEGTTLS